MGAELAKLTGTPPNAPPPPPKAALPLLRQYFIESIAALKAARAQARKLSARHNVQLELPQCPDCAGEVKALLDAAGPGET